MWIISGSERPGMITHFDMSFEWFDRKCEECGIWTTWS